jgi:hypothetical protein
MVSMDLGAFDIRGSISWNLHFELKQLSVIVRVHSLLKKVNRSEIHFTRRKNVAGPEYKMRMGWGEA